MVVELCDMIIVRQCYIKSNSMKRSNFFLRIAPLQTALKLAALMAPLCLSGCAHRVYETTPMSNKHVEGFTVGTLTASMVNFVGNDISNSMTHSVFGLAGIVYGSYKSSPYYLTRELRVRGAQVLRYGDTVAVLLPVNGVFERRSAKIKHNAYNTLALVARLARAFPGTDVRISGNTNNIGLMQENVRLSRAQAKSVRAYLWAEGVDFKRLYAVGYGELDPIASNRTIRGRETNNRIEITFHKSSPESWDAAPSQVPTTKWG